MTYLISKFVRIGGLVPPIFNVTCTWGMCDRESLQSMAGMQNHGASWYYTNVPFGPGLHCHLFANIPYFTVPFLATSYSHFLASRSAFTCESAFRSDSQFPASFPLLYHLAPFILQYLLILVLSLLLNLLLSFPRAPLPFFRQLMTSFSSFSSSFFCYLSSFFAFF